MKRVIFILISLWCVSGLKAQESTRIFSFKAPAADFKELALGNRYGNIELRQGGDVFDIQAVIVVNAKTQAKAEEVMQYIRIDTDESSPVLRISTVFEKDLSVSRLFSGVTVDVDYRIRVPKGKLLRIANKDGNVMAGNYTGDLSLEVESGSFVARSLRDGHVSVRISKGDFEVPEVDRLTGDFRSGNVKIDAGRELKLECSSASVRIMEADKLGVKSSSGSCYLGTVEELSLNSSYTKYEVQDIGGSLQADCRWGELNVRNINLSFSDINVKSSYAKVGLTFMEGCGYHLELQYNKSLKTDIPGDFSLEEKPTTNSNVILKTGFIGNPKLEGKVVLNLSGGTFYIR